MPVIILGAQLPGLFQFSRARGHKLHDIHSARRAMTSESFLSFHQEINFLRTKGQRSRSLILVFLTSIDRSVLWSRQKSNWRTSSSPTEKVMPPSGRSKRVSTSKLKSILRASFLIRTTTRLSRWKAEENIKDADAADSDDGLGIVEPVGH